MFLLLDVHEHDKKRRCPWQKTGHRHKKWCTFSVPFTIWQKANKCVSEKDTWEADLSLSSLVFLYVHTREYTSSVCAYTHSAAHLTRAPEWCSEWVWCVSTGFNCASSVTVSLSLIYTHTLHDSDPMHLIRWRPCLYPPAKALPLSLFLSLSLPLSLSFSPLSLFSMP